VAVTCRVLKLARQPYYRWRATPVTDAELVEAYQANALFDAHRDDPEFGYRYLSEEARQAGEPMAEGTAWRICTDNRWSSVFGTKRVKNGKVGPPVHDLVERDFTADAANRWWLSDITEHPTREGKLYLCAIKDTFSNRIVGYCIDSRMKSRLATTALSSAVARCGEVAGCILHTDRGSQFRSRKFVHALGRYDMVGSLGRVGACRGQRGHGIVLQPAAEERAGPPPLGHARRAADRDRHLDRTDLPPPPAPGRSRTVDPHRIRSNHDHTGQPGRITETVALPCSRPKSAFTPVKGY
jgi:putative transposase